MTGANNSNAFRRAAAHTTAGKVVDRGTLTGITASRDIRYTGTDFFLDSNHRRACTGTSLVVGSHHADDPLAFRHVLPDSALTEVFNLAGVKLRSTTDRRISDLNHGVYIVRVAGKVFKVSI